MQMEFAARSLIAGFFRQSRRVAVVYLLVMLGGILYLNLVKPTYEAAGSLLVKFGSNMPEKIMHGENGTAVILRDDHREIIRSDIALMQSNNLLLALVNEIGPENLYPGITQRLKDIDSPAEAAVEQLLKRDLIIKAAESSNIIEVKLQNPHPRIAAYFVQQLMRMFIARQSEIYSKPQTDLLQEQIRQAGIKLEQSQKQLEDFKAKNGISSLDDEMADLLRQKSNTATTTLESTDKAWDKLSELQSEEQRLLQTYRPDSPQVQLAHQNVVLAQQQLRNRQAERQSRVKNETARINRHINLLESRRKQYDDLKRQVKIDESNYENYQLSSEKEQINATLDQRNTASVVVVDEPAVPLRPVYPRKLLAIVLSALAGIILSLGVALALESSDQRFTDPAQLARILKIPVMASFNRIPGGRSI